MADRTPLLTTRRALIGTAAALPLLRVSPSYADEQVVVGTWGGDYANLLRDNVEPLLKGITIVADIGDEDPRVAKLYAQRRLPRGTVDVACVQAVRGNELATSGLLEPLDTTKVPNLAHLHPFLKTDNFAPHIYSLQVLIYNPDKVTNPPKTLADLTDPKYKGKVGVGNGNYFYVMMACALAATGDANKVDSAEARAMAMKLNDNGLRLYSSTDAIGAGMKSGEIDVGVMWLARVHMWQGAGIPVKASFPTEGNILYVSGMVVPKNAPNKAGAYAYLNAMLEPAAQTRFAERMGYLPTVDNDKLTGTLGEELALPADVKMVPPDYGIVGKLQSATSEWWNKTMTRA